MSAGAMPSQEPLPSEVVPAGADVLVMCEIWLALDFPEPSAVGAAAPPDPQEVP